MPQYLYATEKHIPINIKFKKINIGGKKMSLLKDEKGQGAAEYILLFGGVIVIAVAALLIYQQYFSNTNLDSEADIQDVRGSVTSRQTI